MGALPPSSPAFSRHTPLLVFQGSSFLEIDTNPEESVHQSSFAHPRDAGGVGLASCDV